MNTSQQPQVAAIYARVSSEEQVQGYSIQAQLRACREWAEKHGYTVAKEYLEQGQSAFRNLEKREALKELLWAYETRSANIVTLAASLDRHTEAIREQRDTISSIAQSTKFLSSSERARLEREGKRFNF